MDEYNSNLKSAIYSALVDSQENVSDKFSPKLVLNKNNITRIGATINNELNTCMEFYFSVAFINEAGITYLLQSLKNLNDLGIKGKLLTSTYLNFNSPNSFRRLLDITNLEVRITNKNNFHAKGYIFKHSNNYSILVGSSNMTDSAFSRNTEWNIILTSNYNGKLIKETLNEFDSEWKDSFSLNKTWIEEYSKIYIEQKLIDKKQKSSSIVLKPNNMQLEALGNLSRIRVNNKRALIISATGTGKTYLAAFDCKNFSEKFDRNIKVLFVAHRERLLNAAKDSFRNVFKDETISMGIFNATFKNTNVDFLFASVNTLSKQTNLEKFEKNHFDYIVFDEAHHCGAQSYQNILNYFKPYFTLGMTATPERSDGYNIYELFDYNIGYEIRLQQALKEEMLCPFHYFGIEDIEYKDHSLENVDFNKIFNEEKINYIISSSKYYGYSGNRVKGLIFVSRIEIAYELEIALNNKGFKTKAVCGIDSEDERNHYIEMLESDGYEHLDYIISVDVLSEGVDIPCVNQILMLRPTESVIVFVQQLGRGLRKFEDKDFLIVIDFIGNYENNYLIPVALSGDKTYGKDNIRRFVREKAVMLPPGTNVSFSNVVEEKIYNSIASARFSNLAFLKTKYLNLKYKLGKIPSLVDFYMQGDLDPSIILEYAKNYHLFLTKVDKEYNFIFSNSENIFLEQISKFLSNGKRVHELVILKYLLENLNTNKDIISKILAEEFHITNDEKSLDSAIRNLNGNFYSGQDKVKYYNFKFIEEFDGQISKTALFSNALKNRNFYIMFLDVVEYSLLKYNQEYSEERLENNLCLYKKYTRRDVCRLLNWSSDETSTIYGYKINNDTCPMFVIYEKDENISVSTKYEDKFINEETFSWMTRSKRTLTSNEVKKIVDAQNKGISLHMFVKKGDSEGRDFYYLGEVKSITGQVKELTMKDKNGKEVPVVNIPMRFTNVVREDIYDYLTN